jgi:hypothetical protein
MGTLDGMRGPDWNTRKPIGVWDAALGSVRVLVRAGGALPGGLSREWPHRCLARNAALLARRGQRVWLVRKGQ